MSRGRSQHLLDYVVLFVSVEIQWRFFMDHSRLVNFIFRGVQPFSFCKGHYARQIRKVYECRSENIFVHWNNMECLGTQQAVDNKCWILSLIAKVQKLASTKIHLYFVSKPLLSNLGRSIWLYLYAFMNFKLVKVCEMNVGERWLWTGIDAQCSLTDRSLAMFTSLEVWHQIFRLVREL